jgi:hypothetical protein
MADVIITPGGTTHTTGTTQTTGTAPASEYVVMDLGRHSAKRVRRLRRGKGKLLQTVQDAINELKANGINQPIVLVVERKSTQTSPMFPLPIFAFNDDDDDDVDDDDYDDDDDDC